MLTIDLLNRQQAWAAMKEQLHPYLAQHLQDGRQLVLTCGPRKRTAAQNKRYWGGGVLAQIAAKAAPGGQHHSAEAWHELFKRLFLGVEQLPGGGIIGKSSTGLTTAEFSEFCDRVEAYAAADLGVTFEDLPTKA